MYQKVCCTNVQRSWFAHLGPVIENESIDSRPHYRFDTFWTVHTKTFENDRIARCDVRWTLCACHKTHASAICVFDRQVDCHTIIRYVCVFLLIHFQESFQIDAFSMKTPPISVVGRPKRIEMFAISNENALVWTGPKPIALLLFLVAGAVRWSDEGFYLNIQLKHNLARLMSFVIEFYPLSWVEARGRTK